MIIKGVTAVVIMALSFVIVSSMMVEVNQANESVRTQSATANLGCTPSGSNTYCDITLPSKHQYDTAASMTVTETSPGSNVNRTSDSVLQSDQVTIRVSNLVAATAYLFTVDYKALAQGVDQTTSDVMALLPLGMVVGVLIISILWLLSSLGVMTSAGRN